MGRHKPNDSYCSLEAISTKHYSAVDIGDFGFRVLGANYLCGAEWYKEELIRWWRTESHDDVNRADVRPAPSPGPSKYFAVVNNKTPVNFHIDIFKDGDWWHDQFIPAGGQVFVGSTAATMGLRICGEEKRYPWHGDHWTIDAWEKERSVVPAYDLFFGDHDRVFLRKTVR